MKRFLILGAVLFLAACTDSDKAKETLENAGYENVQTHGYAWFACGERDVWQTSFTATAPNGNTVSGAVCEGVFKGSTIRFD